MRKITIEEKWHQQSEAAKNAAKDLPHGKERDALIKKARQKDGSFIYGCERRRIESKTAEADMWVGFETDQDLALDQVENRTQFLEFMSGNLSK